VSDELANYLTMALDPSAGNIVELMSQQVPGYRDRINKLEGELVPIVIKPFPSILNKLEHLNLANFVVYLRVIYLPYFIEYSAHKSIVCTFILLNTLLMNKAECYLPSIVRMQYFSIIFYEKSVHYNH
jgi:hypothetical protein